MAIVKIDDEKYFKKYGKPISYYVEDWVKNRFDNKVLPDLHKKDKDCVIAIDGSEGCLFEDTLIKTSKGNIKIKELCDGKEFVVESLDTKNDKNVSGKAICIDSGVKELFEIETEDGRIVKATADHTFFVMRNKKVYEVKLSELKEGDELICSVYFKNNIKKNTTTIKSIKKIGSGKTYDLKVYPFRNFYLSNGLLSHNSGKSTVGLQWSKYVDPTFNLDRVVFTPEEFREAIHKAKNGQAVLFDEAFSGFSSRAALSGVNRVLISLMMQIRQKNLFVVIVLPTVFLLDKYISLFRTRILVHVYENKGRRGYFRVYSKEKKRQLIMDKKARSYSYGVRSRKKGRFYGVFALGDKEDEEKYRKKKLKALESAEHSPMQSSAIKYREQRNLMLYVLRKELKMGYRKIENLLNDFGFDLSYRQIASICAKFGDKPLDIGEKDDLEDKKSEKDDKNKEN